MLLLYWKRLSADFRVRRVQDIVKPEDRTVRRIAHRAGAGSISLRVYGAENMLLILATVLSRSA